MMSKATFWGYAINFNSTIYSNQSFVDTVINKVWIVSKWMMVMDPEKHSLWLGPIYIVPNNKQL